MILGTILRNSYDPIVAKFGRSITRQREAPKLVLKKPTLVKHMLAALKTLTALQKAIVESSSLVSRVNSRIVSVETFL